jgi:hypothetical protein
VLWCLRQLVAESKHAGYCGFVGHKSYQLSAVSRRLSACTSDYQVGKQDSKCGRSPRAALDLADV